MTNKEENTKQKSKKKKNSNKDRTTNNKKKKPDQKTEQKHCTKKKQSVLWLLCSGLYRSTLHFGEATGPNSVGPRSVTAVSWEEGRGGGGFWASFRSELPPSFAEEVCPHN